MIQKQEKIVDIENPLSCFKYLEDIQNHPLNFNHISFRNVPKSEVNFVLVYGILNIGVGIFSVANFLLQISDFTCRYAIDTKNPVHKHRKEWSMSDSCRTINNY